MTPLWTPEHIRAALETAQAADEELARAKQAHANAIAQREAVLRAIRALVLCVGDYTHSPPGGSQGARRHAVESAVIKIDYGKAEVRLRGYEYEWDYELARIARVKDRIGNVKSWRLAFPIRWLNSPLAAISEAMAAKDARLAAAKERQRLAAEEAARKAAEEQEARDQAEWIRLSKKYEGSP